MSEARRDGVRSRAKRGVRARPASAGPTASQAEAIAKIAPARAAAFEILTLLGEGKGHSDELLCGAGSGVRMEALEPEDRNLTTALAMGVLRWQIALDARVAKLLARPEQRLAEPVALALRMGAFQLLHMDRIPAHAVLHESVEMCRAAGQPHAAGMVNAVLRKLAVEQSTSQNRDAGHPLHESTAAIAERLGHPLWLVERWVAEYGREAVLAICEYDQHEPGRGAIFSDADDEAAELAGEGAPQMDDGSRLVAELAAAAMPASTTAGRAARVWDCCAAPGGKALMLALRLTGAEILATDVSAKRMAQMAVRLRRYAYAQRVSCAVADASSATLETPQDEKFDLVLCDVPCSGTGTLARNPEIRLRLQPEDLARQSARQRAILSGALRRLAPGGRLVYSTCSLEPEENERVVEAVAPGAGVRRISMEPLIASLADTGVLRRQVSARLIGSAVKNGALRTLPGVHGCDGFFAVALERG
ncbi:MAG: RsmB/NOP family class I SAM-dependent RNA methyltransferase [Acidobacteriaceae bacterium]